MRRTDSLEKTLMLGKIEGKRRNIVDVAQSLSHLQLFVTPRTESRQASLSFPISQSLIKLMSIESVIPSNHLILCLSLLLLPSIFPSIRVFSNESVLCIKWPKYWSFSFSISPLSIQDWFPLGLTGLISLLPKGYPNVFISGTISLFPIFCSALHITLFTTSHLGRFIASPVTTKSIVSQKKVTVIILSNI